MRRRDFLTGAAVLGAGLLPKIARADVERRFLIVVGAWGGASIIDGPLARTASEVPTPETLNVFPDPLVHRVEGTPFRAVNLELDRVGSLTYRFQSDQRGFVERHGRQMVVATVTGTSVNHAIGQRRSVTGNEAWRGRTLQEAVAMRWGEGLPLPNVALTTGGGFTEPGSDPELPSWARAEVVARPDVYPLSLHSVEGSGFSGPQDSLQSARALRDRLEGASRFGAALGQSPRIQHWRRARAARAALEAQDLIRRLMFRPDAPNWPLAAYGLSSAPAAREVRDAFPDWADDPLDAQAALAFLLLDAGASASVTIGPNADFAYAGTEPPNDGALPEGALLSPPLAFDQSHQETRSTQAFMWSRIYRVVDRLIALLRSRPYGDRGESLWDRTLISVATEFGRTRRRPAGAEAWGSGHDLDNGVVLLSPMIRGGRVLGGVAPEDLRPFGFDLLTGAPDPGRRTSEPELYAGILDAMGVETEGLPAVTAIRG